MENSSTNIVRRPQDVTAQWLTEALGGAPVSSFEYSRIGTGQVSECYRFKLIYHHSSTDPESVILKVAAQDETSRHAGISLGLYEREVRFYQVIAGSLPPCIPHCYHASSHLETHSFCILIQDAIGMDSGDDVHGATLEQAKSCVSMMGGIHGASLRRGVDETPWLKSGMKLTQDTLQLLFDGFVTRYRDVLATEDFDLCSRLVGCFDAYRTQWPQTCVQGMVHGDFRLDNILLRGDEALVVDWQTITWGPILGDLAYFLGCAVPVELRRAHHDELIELYHASLGPDSPLTLARCHEDLRNQSFFGITMGIASSMLVQQTERGDEMFTTMVKRHCALVRDLNALAILPLPTKLDALQPSPEDEALHPRSDEPLFNESYYFDFVDEKQGIAAYVRLGITPNVSKGGWYLAVISRHGKPLTTIMDYGTPIVDDKLHLKTSSYEASHEAIDALKKFRITLRGDAAVYSDPSSIFRSKPAQGSAALAFDLTFHTDGTPYQYRVTTRYEIPCLVSGTVSVDGESFSISQQVGQRDHSWGVRDWWNMDWLWGALHLEDGNHIHLVDIHIRGQGQLGIGYLQQAGKEVHELRAIDTKWEIDDKSNLVNGSTLTFTPHGQPPYHVKTTSIGHGPLRLVAEDGRVAFFDRAWCQCVLEDGRIGHGWVEWNRVQS